jgi:uncharacterized membrane protein
MEIRPKQARSSSSYVAAVLLIVIGLGVLVNNLGGGRFGGSFVPLAVGVAFLVANAVARKYGYLVPGGILTGVGAGMLTASLLNVSDQGALAAIGGGIGFLLIYAIDLIVSGAAARWWPVIPGSLMVVAGASVAGDNQEAIRRLGQWSPLLLIALGIWILVARSRTRSH